VAPRVSALGKTVTHRPSFADDVTANAIFPVTRPAYRRCIHNKNEENVDAGRFTMVVVLR
jgi:hypothetical protein